MLDMQSETGMDLDQAQTQPTSVREASNCRRADDDPFRPE